MYAGAWRSLPDACFLDWRTCVGEKSLAGVASRLIVENGIGDGAIVVGSSLGAMVACEMAKLRRLRGLVLVGGAKNKEEISGVLYALRPLIDFAPLELIQYAAGKVPEELAQMLSRSEPAFIRAMCRAIFEWEGLDESRLTPLRIHGKHDHVIPLPAKIDLVLNGGHLIAMTHASECVDFIRGSLLSPNR